MRQRVRIECRVRAELLDDLHQVTDNAKGEDDDCKDVSAIVWPTEDLCHAFVAVFYMCKKERETRNRRGELVFVHGADIERLQRNNGACLVLPPSYTEMNREKSRFSSSSVRGS